MERRIFMKQVSVGKVWFWLSALGFFLLSVSALLSPLSSFDGAPRQLAAAYVTAGLFWLGLISGIVFWGLFVRSQQVPGVKTRPDFLGVFKSVCRFFRNTPATIVDIALIAGTTGVILSLIFYSMNVWITSASLFVFLFSLAMHFICNGPEFDRMYLQMKSTGKEEDGVSECRKSG